MQNYDISYENVKRLADMARAGSTEAIRELLRLRSLSADKANKRLRSLEKAGYTEGTSYERAVSYIKETGSGSGARFRVGTSTKAVTGSKEDARHFVSEVKRDIEEVRAFLNSKLSTVKGVEASREKRWNTFSKIGDIEGDTGDIGRTNAQKDAFLKYLGSAQGQRFKKCFKSSDDWLEALLQMRHSDATMKDIRTEVRGILNELENGGTIKNEADILDSIAEKYGKE